MKQVRKKHICEEGMDEWLVLPRGKALRLEQKHETPGSSACWETEVLTALFLVHSIKGPNYGYRVELRPDASKQLSVDTDQIFKPFWQVRIIERESSIKTSVELTQSNKNQKACLLTISILQKSLHFKECIKRIKINVELVNMTTQGEKNII